LRRGKFSELSDVSFSRSTSKGKIRCINKNVCRWKAGKNTIITFRKACPVTTPKKRSAIKDAPKAPAKNLTPKKRTKGAALQELAEGATMPTKKAKLAVVEDTASPSSEDEAYFKGIAKKLQTDLDRQKKLHDTIKVRADLDIKRQQQIVDSTKEKADSELKMKNREVEKGSKLIKILKTELAKANDELAKAKHALLPANKDTAMQAQPKKDDSLETELIGLRAQSKSQAKQIEKMNAKMAAYKLHMDNLRRTNESLQSIADL
jgi:hypothetical protein